MADSDMDLLYTDYTAGKDIRNRSRNEGLLVILIEDLCHFYTISVDRKLENLISLWDRISLYYHRSVLSFSQYLFTMELK